MASGSHRFGVRFMPNRAWRVTYRGPILGGGKTRKKGRGKERARAERHAGEIVRREERAGEADLPASRRAEEEPESTPRPRGRVFPRRREKSPAGRGRCSGPLPLPSRLLWSSIELPLLVRPCSGPPPPLVLCRAASSGPPLLWSSASSGLPSCLLKSSVEPPPLVSRY
jgi:hypothetical protein